MALFGLEIFPALLFFGLITGKLKNHFRFSMQRILPVGLAVVAILLILRGLALDIPFVIPHLPPTPLSQTTDNPTCH